MIRILLYFAVFVLVLGLLSYFFRGDGGGWDRDDEDDPGDPPDPSDRIDPPVDAPERKPEDLDV